MRLLSSLLLRVSVKRLDATTLDMHPARSGRLSPDWRAGRWNLASAVPERGIHPGHHPISPRLCNIWPCHYSLQFNLFDLFEHSRGIW